MLKILRWFIWKLRANTEISRKHATASGQVESEAHRASRIEMANVWKKLAEEAENKAF